MVNINGRNYAMVNGSRAQVGHGTAYKTTGGLTRSKLKFNPKTNRWVSLRKHKWGKTEGKQQFARAGYALFSKGAPGVVRTIGTKRRSSTRRRRA